MVKQRQIQLLNLGSSLRKHKWVVKWDNEVRKRMCQSFYQCGKQGCNNNGDTLRLPMGWTSQWSQWKTGLPIPAPTGCGFFWCWCVNSPFSPWACSVSWSKLPKRCKSWGKGYQMKLSACWILWTIAVAEFRWVELIKAWNS